MGFNMAVLKKDMKGGKGDKVAWEKICVRKEVVLNLKMVHEWNNAVANEHIWYWFAKTGSIWVAWILQNMLRGKRFWMVKVTLGQQP